VRIWDPVTDGASNLIAGHTGSVRSVAFGATPDGRLLLASTSPDGRVQTWDPITGAPTTEPLTGRTGSVDSVAFGTTPDGHLLLASASPDRHPRSLDVKPQSFPGSLRAAARRSPRRRGCGS
jgi:WD40 repeat protein